jgi:hypothetical protein
MLAGKCQTTRPAGTRRWQRNVGWIRVDAVHWRAPANAEMFATGAGARLTTLSICLLTYIRQVPVRISTEAPTVAFRGSSQSLRDIV